MPVPLEGSVAAKPVPSRAMSLLVGAAVTLAVLVAGNAFFSKSSPGSITGPTSVVGYSD